MGRTGKFVPTGGSESRSLARLWPDTDTVARVLGFFVVFVGLACIVSAVSPLWRSRLLAVDTFVTPGANSIATGTIAVFGIALVLMGRGVVQRHRAAARAATVLLFGAGAMHLGQHHPRAAFLCAVLAFALVSCRGAFVVVAEPHRARNVMRLTIGLLALDFVAGLVAIGLEHSHVQPSPTPRRALHEVAARLIGGNGPLQLNGRTWYPALLTVLGSLTLAIALFAALAPVALRGGADEDDREHVRRLIESGEATTLDPFALRSDKRYVFSPDRRAAIAYRYLNGAGLAAGDPFGERAEVAGAVEAYVALCDRNGWRPGVYGTSESVVPLYRAAGLRSFYIGDEALVDVAPFTLEGRPMRGVRQAVHRVERAGVSTSMCREQEVTPELRAALFAVAADQRGKAPERGFAMTLGGLFDGSQPHCLIFVAHAGDGAPIGFQRYVPCGGGRALSLDFMRRRRNSPNGVNEYLIVQAIEWAKRHGVGEVSLNFAAFRALLDEDADLESLQSVEAWLVRRLEGRFGIQMDSLRRFNAKFRPRWVPRHLVYRRPGDLPAVGMAALSAEAFLPFDRHREEVAF